MTSSVLAAVLIAAAGFGTTLTEEDKAFQNQVFQHFWGTDFEWTFESLPEKGGVPRARMPYSGYIYPDTNGGTRNALRKWDRAFHGGRSLAESHEKWDTTAFKEPIERRGPLGLMTWGTRMGTPDWYGHCNGWTAASIRHAEPQMNVEHNGVVFAPADIKALLAEIYLYNEHVDLSGGGVEGEGEDGEAMHPALLHAVVTNWMGRGSHPLGMESDLSDEKWNYPTYAFNLAYARRTATKIEVKMNLAYILDSSEEYDESPRYRRMKSFHYLLTLNAAGEIIGGSYFDDSSKIEMLWLPLRPREVGKEGNEEGNPYLNTGEVLALWRQSVPKELRGSWPVVDPSAEDRAVVAAKSERLIPLGHRVSTEVASRAMETTDAAAARPPDTITVLRVETSPKSTAEPAMDAPSEAYWPPVHGVED